MKTFLPCLLARLNPIRTLKPTSDWTHSALDWTRNSAILNKARLLEKTNSNIRMPCDSEWPRVLLSGCVAQTSLLTNGVLTVRIVRVSHLHTQPAPRAPLGPLSWPGEAVGVSRRWGQDWELVWLWCNIVRASHTPLTTREDSSGGAD